MSRLQRSFVAEIAPDRHYFLSKADALQDAATRLVQRCEEVEAGSPRIVVAEKGRPSDR
jgi:hypothetical protein